MVSYDDRGFYGHPDHVQAHRVAWRAFHLAGDPAVSVPAVVTRLRPAGPSAG